MPKSLPYLKTSELNDLNRTFYARLAARSDIAITHTDLNGVFCVRMAIGAERTEEGDIDKALTLIEEEARVVLSEWGRMRLGIETGVAQRCQCVDVSVLNGYPVEYRGLDTRCE